MDSKRPSVYYPLVTIRVNPEAFRRPKRTSKKEGRGPGRPPKEPDPPSPTFHYTGSVRSWFADRQVQKWAFAALLRNLSSEDGAVRQKAVDALQLRGLGKPQAEGELREAVPAAESTIATAQEHLEGVLTRLVGDLKRRVDEGCTGPALLAEAARGAEVLKDLLERRKEGASLSGLQGMAATDLVQAAAERMGVAELTDVRARLERIQAAKEGMQ